jgi:hypothetical protein
LFVRYWDDTLTPDEAEELERRLAEDPAAREWFQTFTLQAVAAADLRAARTEQAKRSERSERSEDTDTDTDTDADSEPEPAHARRVSRRRMLAYMSGGLAAGVAAVAFGRWLVPEQARQVVPDHSVRLGAIRGEVTVLTADGNKVSTDEPVPPGSTVAASGPGASAILFYRNGTNVALTEDSSVTLGARDDHLRVDRGVVAADLRPPLIGGTPLTLTTAETVLGVGTEAIVTLFQAVSATEVGVQRGLVNVTAPKTGISLGELRDGELLTVQAGGELQKQKIPDTPETYDLKLDRPLAPGWTVGKQSKVGTKPVVQTVRWLDPYYDEHMYQIRSDKQWNRGFVRLWYDSVVRVRYNVRQSGEGQVCFCVRTADARSPDTGMLEWKGMYVADQVEPGKWQTLDIRVGSMLNNRHTPKFCNPWIGFLFIFNTYKEDLGLQIAEFGVSRTGGAPGGVPG